MTQSLARGRAGASPVLLGVVGLVAFVGLFEVLPRTGVLPEAYFPAASTIGRTMGTLATEPTFWVSFGETVQTWAIGLAIAVAAGIVLGVLIGTVPVLRAATASTIAPCMRMRWLRATPARPRWCGPRGSRS